MKRWVIISLIYTLTFLESEIYCQATVFSQYYASGLYLNPALAGLEKDTYMGMNYRSQWSNLSLPFNTFQFSFIQPLAKPGARRKHLGGLGISFLNDEAGTNKEFVTQGISVAAAHNFHLNRHGNNIVSAALQVGVNQHRVNFGALQWSSQYSSRDGFDPSLPGEPGMVSDQVFYPVLNAGVMWYYTNKMRNLSHYSTSIYNGISVSNIIPFNGFYMQSERDASILFKAHGGYSSTWTRKVEVSPNYLIQLQDNNFQVNMGMYVGYTVSNPRLSSKAGNTKVLLGLWYRMEDAFIISTGISNSIWNIGFSYDSNVFHLSKAFGYGSAYELSLAYRIVNKGGFKRFSSPLI